MTLLKLAFLSLFIFCADGQVITSGKCQNIPAKPHFDLQQYGGIWHEVERYFSLIEVIGRCQISHYKNIRVEENSFELDLVQLDELTGKRQVNPSKGWVFASHDQSARFDVDLGTPIPLTPLILTINFPFNVLDTDYKTFAIEWACMEIPGGANIQVLWILSRATHYLSQEQRNSVHQKLRDFGLRPDLLIDTDQTNCPSMVE